MRTTQQPNATQQANGLILGDSLWVSFSGLHPQPFGRCAVASPYHLDFSIAFYNSFYGAIVLAPKGPSRKIWS